ncbi:MAG: hypothetical protein NDI87_09520 [Rhodoferax sp.]|nr:hypothetical protein [Rhodoferax sp.]
MTNIWALRHQDTTNYLLLSPSCHQKNEGPGLSYANKIPNPINNSGKTMLAIKKARKLIETNPDEPAAQIIAALVLALESETSISVSQLYKLDDKRFELALEILNEWRLDRHYASKLRLLDSSSMVQSLREMAPETKTIKTP